MPFEKGKSGNDKMKFGKGQDPTKGGHPKGKRVSTIIKELLDTDISNFSDSLEGMETNKALAVELIAMAFHKDNTAKDKLSAIKEILDRIEGKPKQELETTITEVKPTKYEIVNDKDTKASS